jgi:hypothetical protein
LGHRCKHVLDELQKPTLRGPNWTSYWYCLSVITPKWFAFMPVSPELTHINSSSFIQSAGRSPGRHLKLIYNPT